MPTNTKRTAHEQPVADRLGNKIAREGCDRCYCGCKYWENDRCVDCGEHVVGRNQAEVD